MIYQYLYQRAHIINPSIKVADLEYYDKESFSAIIYTSERITTLRRYPSKWIDLKQIKWVELLDV